MCSHLALVFWEVLCRTRFLLVSKHHHVEPGWGWRLWDGTRLILCKEKGVRHQEGSGGIETQETRVILPMNHPECPYTVSHLAPASYFSPSLLPPLFSPVWMVLITSLPVETCSTMSMHLNLLLHQGAGGAVGNV